MSLIKFRAFYLLYPAAILLVGIIIHIIGLFSALIRPLTLWSLWVHFSMLLINTTALTGLLLKKRWGYYTALTVMVLFALTQVSLLAIHFTIIPNLSFEVQNAASFILCSLAAYCLYVIRADQWL